MGKLFGTDGIRGVAGEFLTAELALSVGKAVAQILKKSQGHRPLVVIGKDTRISSDTLESALTAGLTACGADVMPLGVIPTPAVAYLAIKHGADAGIVISASHNSFEHNGIKIFNGSGYKLSDELENAIEELVLSDGKIESCAYGDMGRVVSCGDDPIGEYVEHILSCRGERLPKLKIAVDCANGASSAVAPRLFKALGVEADVYFCEPDGVNINNDCGSTHTDKLADIVVSGGYDMGFAFDGDADRCLAVDKAGRLVDGDKIMGICGMHLHKIGELNGSAIVATVMSNMGFHIFCREQGIKLVCTSVGDRNVLEEMLRSGYIIGGEQSGHLIFSEYETTGDGELAAVYLLSVLGELEKPIGELLDMIPDYPQELINVEIGGGNPEKDRVMACDELKKAVAETEKKLGDTGRVLIRPSGTEPLIRVMVEAESTEKARFEAENLANLVKKL